MRSVLKPHDLTHVQFVLLASLWWLQDHGDHPRPDSPSKPEPIR
jgi:hypothetical protein